MRPISGWASDSVSASQTTGADALAASAAAFSPGTKWRIVRDSADPAKKLETFVLNSAALSRKGNRIRISKNRCAAGSLQDETSRRETLQCCAPDCGIAPRHTR